MTRPEGASWCRKIEIDNIPRQHRASIFSAGFEYQRIIEDALPQLFSLALGSGEHAGKHSGFGPDFPVGSDRPVAGTPGPGVSWRGVLGNA